MTGPGAEDARYVPARVPADPVRDARVAARRAVDARRAGKALDRHLRENGFDGPSYKQGWADGYVAGGGGALAREFEDRPPIRCTCAVPPGSCLVQEHGNSPVDGAVDDDGPRGWRG